MTFDLEAARALHDRDEHGNCDTCTDPAGAYPVRWPCPTATALGATGRTEWAGPHPDTLRRVHIPRAGWYHIGPELGLQPDTTTTATFDSTPLEDALRDAMDASLAGTGTLYVPKIIEYDPATEHVTANGITPKPAPYTICDAHRPEYYPNEDFPCILIADHPGDHTDRDGDRWEQDTQTPAAAEPWPNAAEPCPEPSITGIPDKHCIQHRGHEGPHYFAWTGDYTPCRTPGPRPGTASFCSLGTGHRDAHRNLNGVAWSADERTLGHITPGTVRVTKLHPDGTPAGEPVTTTGILNIQYDTPGDRTHDNHWNRCTRRQGRDPEARRCILDTNHINQHEYHDTIGSGGRCTASRERPGVSRITCALDNGHTTRYHVSPTGIHWGTNPNGPDAPLNHCTVARTLARHCVFIHDHTGAHHFVDARDDNSLCSAAHGGRTRCVLPDTHIGAHRDLNGDTL